MTLSRQYAIEWMRQVRQVYFRYDRGLLGELARMVRLTNDGPVLSCGLTSRGLRCLPVYVPT
jgi:hypothetical protein